MLIAQITRHLYFLRNVFGRVLPFSSEKLFVRQSFNRAWRHEIPPFQTLSHYWIERRFKIFTSMYWYMPFAHILSSVLSLDTFLSHLDKAYVPSLSHTCSSLNLTAYQAGCARGRESVVSTTWSSAATEPPNPCLGPASPCRTYTVSWRIGDSAAASQSCTRKYI